MHLISCEGQGLKYSEAGQPSLLCCLWGRGQRGNNAAGLLGSSSTFQWTIVWDWEFLLPWQIAPLPPYSPQSALSLSFPCSQPHLNGLLPRGGLSLSTCFTNPVDCFFNSLVVRIPCSLIFWHFWLFIDFRLVVIFLLVVWGSKGFLSTPPSWPVLWNSNFTCLTLILFHRSLRLCYFFFYSGWITSIDLS